MTDKQKRFDLGSTSYIQDIEAILKQKHLTQRHHDLYIRSHRLIDGEHIFSLYRRQFVVEVDWIFITDVNFIQAEYLINNRIASLHWKYKSDSEVFNIFYGER